MLSHTSTPKSFYFTSEFMDAVFWNVTCLIHLFLSNNQFLLHNSASTLSASAYTYEWKRYKTYLVVPICMEKYPLHLSCLCLIAALNHGYNILLATTILRLRSFLYHFIKTLSDGIYLSIFNGHITYQNTFQENLRLKVIYITYTNILEIKFNFKLFTI